MNPILRKEDLRDYLGKLDLPLQDIGVRKSKHVLELSCLRSGPHDYKTRSCLGVELERLENVLGIHGLFVDTVAGECRKISEEPPLPCNMVVSFIRKDWR